MNKQTGFLVVLQPRSGSAVVRNARYRGIDRCLHIRRLAQFLGRLMITSSVIIKTTRVSDSQSPVSKGAFEQAKSSS